MNFKKIIRIIGKLFLVTLIIIQFFRIDKTNPEYIQSNDFIEIIKPTKEIASMLKSSCYDCHSNTTTYPWYGDISPISWWLKGHVDHGRGELNFSEWGTYSEKKKSHKLEECAEKIEKTEMPLFSYTLAHGDAKLSKKERSELVNWFKTRY